MKNRWSDSARAASAASRLAAYGPMMGLKPWGDAARAAAYAARAEREVLDRFGVVGASSSSAPFGGALGLAYGSPSADYGKPGITSADAYDERQSDYERAFRDWWSGVRRTEGNIAAFHALVAAAGGAAAAGMGAYRQASGQSPVAGMSSALGRTGRYLTGNEPVYDSSGTLSGWAKTGGRPYSRAFNQPVRQPLSRAGGVPFTRGANVYDPSTGKPVGRARYDAESAGRPSDVRVSRSSSGGKVGSPSQGFPAEGAASPYVFAGFDWGDRRSMEHAMEQYESDMSAAYSAGAEAYRGGVPDVSAAAAAAGYNRGSEVGDAFERGYLNAASAAGGSAVAEAPGGGDAYPAFGGDNASAYNAGMSAFEDGLGLEYAREVGLREGTDAYDAFERGWRDAIAVTGTDDETEPVAPVTGFDALRGGYDPIAEAEFDGRQAYADGLDLNDVIREKELDLDTDSGMAFVRAFQEAARKDAALAAGGSGVSELNPLDSDPAARAEYEQYLRDADTAWEAEMEAKGLDPQGYPLSAAGDGGGEVREAAPKMDDAQIRLNQALSQAVKSQTAKDAARALGLLQGQWGVDADVASQIPPELLGDYERGFADGAAGYDYSVQAPHDRAGVIRRVNAFLNGQIGDEDPMGFWPDHLTGANETRWAEREAALSEGRRGAAGESTAGLLEAAMNWLTTSLAENDREGMNASLAYMADTLAAVQADARDVYLVRRGDGDGEGEGEEVDATMPEYDEDGNEVEDTDRIFEDSLADPNAVPPWDFEKDGFGKLFRGLRNRAHRASCAVGAERAKADARRRCRQRGMANRWSDAARVASAAARLAAYGPMMGMKPWGAAARAASAAARAGHGFMRPDAYDALIEEAKEKGDRAKARRLRRERNDARKNDAKERLREKREERAKARPGGSDLYARTREERAAKRTETYDAMKARGNIKPASERTAKDLVRDNATTVWGLRDPSGGWESRGGTPVTDAVYYSNGNMYDSEGRYIGKAPQSRRKGPVYVNGVWVDAATGRTIPSGAAPKG